jgi:hypothetical protein
MYDALKNLLLSHSFLPIVTARGVENKDKMFFYLEIK